MQRYFTRSQAPVKPTRRTPRLETRFGAGILASRPYAGRMPFTAQDLADAAQMFDAARVEAIEPDWDALAAEAEHQDWYEAQAPTTFGHCLNCSVPYDDLTPDGLCDRCDILGCETSTPNRYC